MPTAISRVLVVLGLLLTVSAEAGALTHTFATPISGDTVSVTVALTDAAEGDAVDITVSIPPGEGDLLGLFGNGYSTRRCRVFHRHDPIRPSRARDHSRVRPRKSRRPRYYR